MMTMMLRPIVLLVLTGMWPVYAQATPADPDATLAARNLLTYLTELPNQSSRRLISGQWGGMALMQMLSHAMLGSSPYQANT
jgi:hypothetical protein